MSILLKIIIFGIMITAFKLGKSCKENRNEYMISGVTAAVLFCVIQLVFFTTFSIPNILLLVTSIIGIFTQKNKEKQEDYLLPFILFTVVAYEIAIFFFL